MKPLQNPEEVWVKWKYNPTYKDIFLDIWFDKNEKSYNEAHETCNQLGNEMIRWLRDTNPDLYDGIHYLTVKEMGAELTSEVE